MEALFWAHASVEGSFSMEIILSQRLERANAIVLPPAPANRSISIVLLEETCFDKSVAICLNHVLACMICNY